ncbi:MAG: flagellar motor switch protein FliN [Planctomycetota bacterium]|nr:MAG: flagellar motor switch protein FliN [Planctomycetota bacterium]
MMGDLQTILKIEAPIIVEIGRLKMSLGDVLALAPGSLIELDKRPEEELELLVNNKMIATGHAVKIGERFGLKIAFVGDVQERIKAMGEQSAEDAGAGGGSGDDDAEALADKMLQGQ